MSLNTINEAIEDSVIGKFLGVDGVDELRSKLIDVIVETVRDQLERAYEYVISPDDVYETIQDKVIDEALEEIKEEYKNYIKEAANKKINGLLNL